MNYKIFLSYSIKEAKLAEHLRNSIYNAFDGNVTFYFANEDILAGEKWKQNLQEALRDCDAILSILTPQYIERPWAYIEWSAFWLANKTSYILLTDEIQVKDIVEPMKDSQTTRLFVEEDVKKLIKAIAKASGTSRNPYEIIPELVNKAIAIYKKLGEEEERHKYLVYKDSIELLPNDDFQKRDIFWYFYDKESDETSAIEVFHKINDNTIKANILLQLLDKQDFKSIEQTFSAIENKHNLIPVLKNIIEYGHEDDTITEKMVEYLAESQTALRALGEFLIKNRNIDSKLVPFIILQFKNRAELRKLGECIIDNNLVTHKMFDFLIQQFYGFNHAELHKLLVYLIHSDKYNPIEIKEQITKLAKENQKEAEKVMNELFLKDKSLVIKLVQVDKIITGLEILSRLEEKINSK